MIEPDPLVIEMARNFSQERLAPGAAAREKAKRIEPEVIAELGELGILGATTPAAWDGSELDAVTYAMLVEEVAAGDGAVSTLVSVHNSPTCEVLNQFGTDAQKDRWLRPLATGRHVGSFGLTEPQAGSDASACARARSARAIVGSSTAPSSSSATPRCRAASSSSPSPIPTPASAASPASSPTRHRPASRCCASRTSSARKRPIPARWRSRTWRSPPISCVGAEGQGYRIALSTLESGRIGIAAQSIGMARAALEYAIGYARDRRAFGKPIIEHQAVAFRLVEAKTKLEAARQLTLHAARLRADGKPALEAAAMAKLFASEAAERICTVAIQTLGGYGFLADYPVERIYRDVRVCQIYEGTSDVQKIILQRML